MAVSGGVVERFGGGAPKITMTGSAAITAGRVVEMTGDRTVGQAAAASVKCVGVALQTYDGTAATGNKLAVATGGVWDLTATGAIAAGDALIAAANGTVSSAGATPDARTVIGRALAAIAGGQSGPCMVNLGG